MDPREGLLLIHVNFQGGRVHPAVSRGKGSPECQQSACAPGSLECGFIDPDQDMPRERDYVAGTDWNDCIPIDWRTGMTMLTRWNRSATVC